MRMRAALGGFALAFTPGFNVANVGAVADQVSHAYGVGLAVVGLFTTGAVRHARGDAGADGPALRPVRRARRRRRRVS